MKNFSKKFTSVLLVLMMVLSMGITASAASKSDYSIEVQQGKLLFIQNGKTIGTFSTKNSNITLTTDSDKDFLVCFYDSNGKYRSITLGNQKSLSVKGTMDSLTISKNLDTDINVTLAPASNVADLKISASNDVVIKGKVGTLSVNAAADVTISSSAKISKKSITNKMADIITEKGALVGKITEKASSITKKPAASSKNSSKKSSTKKSTSNSRITLKTKAIYAESGDTLSDLLEDLNDHVEAYDRVTDDYISGEVEWTSRRRAELDDDGTFSFVFTPDDNEFDSIKGSIKVYVDTGHGDITLHFEKKTIEAEDGTRLRELNEELDDIVWAEDDEGDEVEGKARFNNSSTKVDADRTRSYKFTFTPRNSRYNKETDSIEIKAK